LGKKYISIKDRDKKFKRKRNQLKNKIRTDESLSPDEKKKLKKRLSRMGKGSVRTISGGLPGLGKKK
jgi:hypothetical protein|tara:strand:- start:1131 stop:1331 length:201 start_codon:yes stop_codon:yes gene_type:complete